MGNRALTSWRRVVLDGKETARLWCPECGTAGLLDGHEIDHQGHVSPSVDCPTSGCEFHQYVQLLGWGKERDDFSRDNQGRL